MTGLGCTTIPDRRFTLDSLDFDGNDEIDDDEIEQHIATRETPRFLGVFSGVLYDYEIFDRHVLERDLQRIERYYRARGFYGARVRAGRVFLKGRGARVEIVIEEGPEVEVARVDIHGLEGLPAEVAASARERVAGVLAPGQRFEEKAFEDAREQLRRELADSGYASAQVAPSADVDLPRSRASVGFWVEPGEPKKLGKIRLEGLGPVPEAPVWRALDLEPGDVYSESDIDEAEQALLGLGAFSSVDIRPDLEAAKTSDRVPITVHLEPTEFRTVRLGVGGQLDTLRTDLHVLAGWEDGNFLGGLRKFSIELVPGVVLYPTRLPSLEKPERLLPQAKLRAEFRQPGFLEPRTNALVRGQGNIYPVILSAERDEDAPILGYRDYRAAAGLERTIWKLYGLGTHNLQINVPFAYAGTLDPDLDTVVVSYVELFSALDLRNDRVSPHEGAYLSARAQLAGVGGDARDVKIQPEARGYIPLARSLTLSLRATTGFLLPDNYGDTLVSNAFQGTPGDASRAEWVKDVQILFLRGFFSGGPGSNRGYGTREIGPHGAVPFYNPGQSSGDITADCSDPDASPNCDLPLGGLALWEASVELRFPLLGPLTGALFSDGSDVSPYRFELRFDRPHLSAGLGIRYDTPVGPVRLDVGYRLPGLQAPASRDEGTSPSEVFGLPAAVSLGIGESF